MSLMLTNIFAVPHNPETGQEAVIIHLTCYKPATEERRDLHNTKKGPVKGAKWRQLGKGMLPCSSIAKAAFWGTSQSNQKCQTKCWKKHFIVKDITFGKVFHQHKLKIAARQICFPDSWASWSTDLKHLCLQSSSPSQYHCYTPLTKILMYMLSRQQKMLNKKHQEIWWGSTDNCSPTAARVRLVSVQSIELCLIFILFFPINCNFLQARILTVWYFL